MSAIIFSPKIGPVPIDVFIKEDHYNELDITANPIETGAEVNDHAYIKPEELTLEIADSNAAATHLALVNFQKSRRTFTIVSGLNIYTSMLIKSINSVRDKDTDKILKSSVTIREVKIAETATSASSSSDKQTGKAGGKKSTRASAPTSQTVKQEGITPDRAAGTVGRGDSPVTTVPAAQNGSILKAALG